MNSEAFLRQVARYYLELSEEKQQNVALVFPNRRAGVFFRRELAAIHQKSLWLPDLFSADEFVRKVTRTQAIDPVSVQYEFYRIYKASEGDDAESFDTYLSWAPQLLHDYEETDLYLVDAVKLYASVDAAYAMKNWSPDGKVITATQQQYIHFWSKMGTWYHQLRRHLLNEGKYTTGMAFRVLAESAPRYLENVVWDKVIFAGFNALNGAEQQYMRFFERAGMAEVIWDTDPYYLDDELNEAGYFFRKYRREWPIKTFNYSAPMLNRPEQNIHMIGVAKNMGQAQYAGSLLDTLAKSDPKLEQTAVVLCDEKLLMPLLELLPASVERANITMGYPLNQLPVSALFSLQFEIQRKLKVNGNKVSVYFRDLQKFFRQPDIRRLLGEGISGQLLDYVNQERYIYLSFQTLAERFPATERLRFLFEPWHDNVNFAMKQLHKLVVELKEMYLSEASERQGYSLEALVQVSALLNKIERWELTYPGYNTLRTLQKVFQQLLRQSTLDFYGEPLEGLQIMGLLETRNLDFRNLILLSVNEGIMPAPRSERSFIPTDIAAAFGLPTYKERDAIYGYHFYRMLQRAENVWLIYNTETDEFGKGEQSRFITQISKEFNRAKLHYSTVVPDLPKLLRSEITVEKSNELIAQMVKRYTEEKRFLSPSALQNYTACGLKFYLKYFSGVRIKEDREDDVDASAIGNILHQTLEHLYKPFVGRNVTTKDISIMLNEFVPVLRESFLEIMEQQDMAHGNNLLIFTGAESMLRNFLLTEQAMLKEGNNTLEIVSLESQLEFTLPVKVGGKQYDIRVGGRADRIDRLNGQLRILDYKSGSVETSELNLESLDIVIHMPSKAKSLQLLFYKMSYEVLNPHETALPGILSLRTPSAGVFGIKQRIPFDMDPDSLKDLFNRVLSQLFSQEYDFEQTEDESVCTYCEFKSLCNR